MPTPPEELRIQEKIVAERQVRRTEELAVRELVLTRVFDAAGELAFMAWIDPEHVEQ